MTVESAKARIVIYKCICNDIRINPFESAGNLYANIPVAFSSVWPFPFIANV